MKTLSLLLCLFLVAFGFYTALFNGNLAGIVLIIIGSVSFIVIAPNTKKVAAYNRNSFMNK